MIKRLFFFSLTIFFCLSVKAQTVFGEPIQTMQYRLEQDSNLLPQLAERFHNMDSTLHLNQLALLYYSYGFRADNDPAKESRILDAASSLGRREQYDEAIRLLDQYLAKNPGCLSALLERAYTSWLVDDSLGTVNGYKKYYQLMEVPLQSGSGNSAEDPIVVSSGRDIELVLDKKGYFIKKQTLMRRGDQKMYQVICGPTSNPKTDQVFYFDVSLVLN